MKNDRMSQGEHNTVTFLACVYEDVDLLPPF